jgi:hypothetical protein
MRYYRDIMSDYEMNEEDIDSMLHYLKLTKPEQATPEIAIAILQRLQIKLDGIEKIDPDAIEAILKDLEDH